MATRSLVPLIVPAGRAIYLDDGKTVLKGPAEIPEGSVSPANLAIFTRNGSVVHGVIQAPALGNRLKQKRKWDVDPLALNGIDLEQLNMMVLDRDPSMEPFETAEEAAAQLSSEYEGD